MSILSPPPRNLAQIPPLPIYRFSLKQYQRMVEIGVLADEATDEFKEGLILAKGEHHEPAIAVLASAAAGPASPPVPVRRFSLQEYQLLLQERILGEDEAVELLEGWIVQKMPHNPPHDALTSLLHNKVIGPRLPEGWFCRGQSAIDTETSEPEPDLAVIRGTELDYYERHPCAKDMALVIEVADTTVQRDRKLKAGMYARAAIPVYWIVNIPEKQIEVYADPTGPDPEPAYRQRRDYGRVDTVPLVIDGRTVDQIAVGIVLP